MLRQIPYLNSLKWQTINGIRQIFFYELQAFGVQLQW